MVYVVILVSVGLEKGVLWSGMAYWEFGELWLRSVAGELDMMRGCLNEWTDGRNWRWCSIAWEVTNYIMLLVGAVAGIVVLIFQHTTLLFTELESIVSHQQKLSHHYPISSKHIHPQDHIP